MVMGLWHLPWGLRLVKPAGGFQDGEKQHQTDQNRKRAPAILSGVVTAWQSQSVGGQASTTKTWEPKALLQTSWLTGTDGLKQDIGRNPAAPDVHSQQRTKNAALDF
ncbi:uncharacterized protein TrAFT101_003808 [Trichoderma asperellum]|uniref:uncharacterized protein n=1 Tax=Trichoderma asperellum TaxID=101201 RepID=UPI0033275C10|nr:hypothetical protein TrAFT101_003808 [Trichoderma asperellum]